mgnify:CR=1 FL=1
MPGGRLSILPFVVKAITAGLRAAPAFNASLDPLKEEIIYKKYYNIGVAVDTGKGLMVPVVKGTDHKSIMQLSADIFNLLNDGTRIIWDPITQTGQYVNGNFINQRFRFGRQWQLGMKLNW